MQVQGRRELQAERIFQVKVGQGSAKPSAACRSDRGALHSRLAGQQGADARGSFDQSASNVDRGTVSRQFQQTSTDAKSNQS